MENESVKNGVFSYFVEMIKCLIVSLIFTLGLVILSALIVKIFNVSTDFIPVLNQINKGTSIFVSIILCFKLQNKGYLRGLIFGLLYILITFLLFSLLNGAFNFSISLLIDAIFGAITGIISGIISVNLRK